MAAAARERAILKELGARIRAQRERVKLSQEVAAARAAIDYKRWQRLEAGDVNPTVRTLTRVARALGTDFWRLLEPTDPPLRH